MALHSMAQASTVAFVEPKRIKRMRKRLGLSQSQFARTFGITLGTFQDWEQGARQPQGPGKTLLRVIEKEPEAVMRAVGAQQPGRKG